MKFSIKRLFLTEMVTEKTKMITVLFFHPLILS